MDTQPTVMITQPPAAARDDLGEWPVLKAWHEKIRQRPAVQAAMRAEGLVK